MAASVLGLDVAIALSLRHRLDAGLRQRLHDPAALAVGVGPDTTTDAGRSSPATGSTPS